MAGKNDAPHPGLLLRESFKEKGWTVTETATRLGVSRHRIARLLQRKGRITPGLALDLEGIGCGAAPFWMETQAYFDLAEECRREKQAAG